MPGLRLDPRLIHQFARSWISVFANATARALVEAFAVIPTPHVKPGGIYVGIQYRVATAVAASERVAFPMPVSTPAVTSTVTVQARNISLTRQVSQGRFGLTRSTARS